MKKHLLLKRLLFLWVLAFSASVWGQTSIQTFGTTDGSNTTTTGNTTTIPNPTSGTTWARGGNGGSVNLIKTSNPLGTTGDYVRAVASNSGPVVKFSPWVGYAGGTAGKEFYTSFKVLFGDSSAGSTATSGVWKFYQGAGAMYSDANDFAGAQVFTGLTFTYGAGGALALTYRAAATNSTTGLTQTNFSSGTVYTIEIVGNNKTSGTINYTYSGVAQTVAVQKFDLYVNGTLIGDDLAEAALPANTSINAGTFIGISSASNVANVFVDDAITYNAVPTSIGTPTYTLTYTAGVNGAITGTSPQTVAQGANGSAVTAVPNTGYHFVNWSDGVLTASRTDTNVQASISVTANFAANPHTVTYNANGGVGTDIVVNKNYGDVVTVAGNTFTRDGYNFTGWNTQADGNGTSYAPSDTFTLSDADVSLYAQWINASLPTQTITFGALADKAYGGTTFDLTASASSGLPVSYSSSNLNVATVSGNTVTILGAGTTIITASQSGGDTYQPADSVDQTLNITQKGLSITGVAVTSKPYDGNTSATYTGGSLVGVVDGDAVGFSGTVAFDDANAGENQAVTATFALTGDDKDNYTLTQPTLTGTISRAEQTLTTFVDATKNSGDAPFTLPATTNAGQTVAYSSSKTSVATVAGNMVTIAGVGTSTITAHADGNTNYNAFDGSIILTVNNLPVLLAGWDFQTTSNGGTAAAVAPNSPLAYTANVGSGNIYLDGTNGSNTWIKVATNNEVTSFAGTNLNTTGTPLSTATTSPACLALLGGAGNAANGKYVVFKFSMTGYENLIVSYATQGTGTGFNSQNWEYSADGVNWTPAQTITPIPTSFAVQTLNMITGLDNATTAYLRFSGSGATSASGNNRLDNIQLNATAAISSATIWNGTAWTNGNPNADVPVTIDGDYAGPSFEAESLTVNAGKTLTVSNYVGSGDVINNGTIIVANNANFLQTGSFTAGTGSTFKVNRNTKEVLRQAYVNWSSPMSSSGQTLKAFSYGKNEDGTNQSTSGTLDNRFYKYNDGLYVATTATGTFTPAGQGYLIRTPNDFSDSNTAVFHGQFEGTTPNSGNITYDASGITGSYVLLGNPYPSAISIDDFWTANGGENAVYIWNSSAALESGVYTGSVYSTYSSIGSNPEGAIDGYLPVGQGFFVDKTVQSYVFNNAMRRGGNSGNFNKTAAVQDRFWLQMTSPSGAKPQMLIGFPPNATAGYDAGYDAKMFDNNSDVIYSTVDGKSLIIDAHGSFTNTDVVNINANFQTVGNYTLGIVQKDGIFSNSQDIYLKDNVTGIVTDLSLGDYTFAATAGLQVNRFTVLFEYSTLAASVVTKAKASIYASNGVVYVKSTDKIAKVEVYDITGKLMKNLAGHQTSETSFPVHYSGVVVVKLTETNGEITAKRVLIK